MKKTFKSFETDSLNLAAYLHTQGVEIISIARAGRFGIFSFDETSARPLVNTYMDGGALISPQNYSNAIRELKRMAEEVIRDEK